MRHRDAGRVCAGGAGEEEADIMTRFETLWSTWKKCIYTQKKFGRRSAKLTEKGVRNRKRVCATAVKGSHQGIHAALRVDRAGRALDAPVMDIVS